MIDVARIERSAQEAVGQSAELNVLARTLVRSAIIKHLIQDKGLTIREALKAYQKMGPGIDFSLVLNLCIKDPEEG